MASGQPQVLAGSKSPGFGLSIPDRAVWPTQIRTLLILQTPMVPACRGISSGNALGAWIDRLRLIATNSGRGRSREHNGKAGSNRYFLQTGEIQLGSPLKLISPLAGADGYARNRSPSGYKLHRLIGICILASWPGPSPRPPRGQRPSSLPPRLLAVA
jgi:hypothetical protein